MLVIMIKRAGRQGRHLRLRDFALDHAENRTISHRSMNLRVDVRGTSGNTLDITIILVLSFYE